MKHRKRKGGKRESLVLAAQNLIHDAGYERMTLAGVAARAKVPLGNVYYYFKTKDALVEAVVASHAESIDEYFGVWEALSDDPRVRLGAMISAPFEYDYAETVVDHGCPYGMLAGDLGQLGPHAPLAKAGAGLLTKHVDWAAGQFAELGLDDAAARVRAVELVGAIQGAQMMGHVFRSMDVLVQQLDRLGKWFDDSVATKTERRRITP